MLASILGPRLQRNDDVVVDEGGSVGSVAFFILGDAISVITFLSTSLPTLFNKQNAWRQTMYEGLQLSCVLADCTSHELSSARDLPYDVQGPCASHAFLSELRL